MAPGHENLGIGHGPLVPGHENLGMGHGPLAPGHENLGMVHGPLAPGHENLGMGHVQACLKLIISLSSLAIIVIQKSTSDFSAHMPVNSGS